VSALAIVPRARAAPYGSRTDVPFGCGNVCAQAIFAGIDGYTGLPSYAVRIANNTQHSIRAHVRAAGSSRAASELEVAPFSILDTLVAGARCANDDRAIVEVRANGLRFTLDAHAALPPRSTRARAGARVAVLALAIAVGAAGWFAAVSAKPRAVAAAARRIVTRTHVVVRRIVEKTLLDELDVSPSAIVAGSPLHVRYGTHVSGTVWLLDDRGRVWARRATDPRGDTVLDVPYSAAGRSLRVVVTAHRGTQHAQMAAGIVVLPDGVRLADTGTPPPAPAVSPRRVASGRVVHVRFAAPHGEAIVSITDPGGSVVEEADVAASQADAELRAPEVAAPSTYDVVVSVVHGHAQDQTVQTLTVLP
jgi:hypothetical protein